MNKQHCDVCGNNDAIAFIVLSKTKINLCPECFNNFQFLKRYGAAVIEPFNQKHEGLFSDNVIIAFLLKEAQAGRVKPIR
jgi:hypothetical protein